MALKTTMRALWYESIGGALKHVEVPVPTPSKDQVLIKLEAAVMNPVDNQIQMGMIRPPLPRKFPFIPVSDVSGEVVAVGPGVTNFKAGDKVVSYLGMSAGGGLAEYAVASQSSTVTRPAEVSAAEAASLPIAGCTAYEALTQQAGINLDGTGPKKNILITAALGDMGHYAVQLAKMGNTHVTATCGARNIDLVKNLGADEVLDNKTPEGAALKSPSGKKYADEVLDYKTPEGAALKSPPGKKYDVVLLCAEGTTPWPTFYPNISENGKVIDLTPSPAALKTTTFDEKLNFSKQWHRLTSPNAEQLEILLKLVKEGKLKTLVEKYPLSRAEEAWAKFIEGHATGKIVVEP